MQMQSRAVCKMSTKYFPKFSTGSTKLGGRDLNEMEDVATLHTTTCKRKRFPT